VPPQFATAEPAGLCVNEFLGQIGKLAAQHLRETLGLGTFGSLGLGRRIDAGGYPRRATAAITAGCHDTRLIQPVEGIGHRPASGGQSSLNALGVFRRGHLVGQLGDGNPHIGTTDRHNFPPEASSVATAITSSPKSRRRSRADSAMIPSSCMCPTHKLGRSDRSMETLFIHNWRSVCVRPAGLSAPTLGRSIVA
jgi:hypothetical protein